jgi:hypothetical protein
VPQFASIVKYVLAFSHSLELNSFEVLACAEEKMVSSSRPSGLSLASIPQKMVAALSIGSASLDH